MRPFYRPSLIFVTFIVVIAQTLTAAGPPKMVISFLDGAVTVSGATPGSEVLVFAAYQDTAGYTSTYGTYQKFVTDDDRDGVVKVDFGGLVPHRSIWIAADTRNGDYTVASPPGYRMQLRDLPANAVTRSGAGDDALSLALGSAEILVLRPGAGAWRGTVDRGGPHDERGVDATKLLVSISRLAALRSREHAPQVLLPKDIVIAVNPFTLETFTTQVGK